MDFLSAQPFPHLILDGVIPLRIAARAAEEFDLIPRELWYCYSGPDEAGKHACPRLEAIRAYAPTCAHILDTLLSPAAVAIVSALTGLDGLVADPSLYGGGLHLMEPGSSLALHLDNEIHPTSGLLRRVNLILYLQSGDGGGDLRLWDRSRANAKRIAPRPARAVLMRTGDDCYHSVERVWAKYTTADKSRKSIALFYWSPPRKRARFLGAAGDAADASREAARRARAGL